MFEVNAIDIAQTVRMIRSAHKGSIIIVEGGSDVKAYSNFIDPGACRLLPANGKDNAINALELLEKEKFGGVVAIVDADLFHLENIVPESPNLLLTDTHDLETMILRTDIFDKIVSEFVDADRVASFEGPIKTKLLENSLILGYFRWVNSRFKEDLNLDFRDLPFNKFINQKYFKIELNNLIEEVKLKSDNYAIDNNRIKFLIGELLKQDHDPWQVCRGHDIVNILSFGLNNVFGFGRDFPTKPEKIEKILRISYGSSYFGKTILFNSINRWESINTSFKILKRLA